MTGRERQPVAYRRAWIGGAAVAGVLFFWLVTVGSWNPLHLEAIETSGFYDAQVHSWFEGRWDVPLEEVGLESFVIDGRNQMYFGPVPALLRVPVLAFTDRLDHRLSALSMTAAYAVTMAATGLLGGRIRRLRRGPEAPVSGAESLTTFGYFVLLGGASLVTFLASRAWVYHEAVLWGIAFAMAAFVAIFDHVTRPSAQTLVLATVFTTAAVGSRLTVGLAAVGALAAVEAAALMGVLGRRLAQRRLETPVRWLGSARVPPLAGLLPVAVPVVLYGLVNWVRFGQVIGIPFDRQIYVSQLQPDRVQALADVGPSGVALEYLPTNLVEYLRPDGFALDRLFPFVTFPRRWPHRFGDIAFAGLEPTASLTFTMPVILGLALFGLVVVFRRGSEAGPSMAPLRPLVLGGALAAVATLCFAWNAHRYQGDFLPLLIVASLAGFHELHARRAARGPEHRRGPVRTWTTRVLLGGLVVALVYVNVGLALVHQRVLSPNAVGRSEFAAFQQDVDELLFSDRAPAAEWGTVLPDDPEAGRLFVIDECDGLYQSIMDGPTDAAWAHWRALERTAATGGYRFRMTFPTRPAATAEPVLVSGPPGDRSLLAVEGLGDGRARFSLALEATGEWFRGEPFAVADGEERLVEIVFDARTLEVAVDVDGEQALRSFFWRAYPGAPITVGRDGAPMVAPRFSGDLVDEPLATPICDRLAARREG